MVVWECLFVLCVRVHISPFCLCVYSICVCVCMRLRVGVIYKRVFACMCTYVYPISSLKCFLYIEYRHTPRPLHIFVPLPPSLFPSPSPSPSTPSSPFLPKSNFLSVDTVQQRGFLADILELQNMIRVAGP